MIWLATAVVLSVMIGAVYAKSFERSNKNDTLGPEIKLFLETGPSADNAFKGEDLESVLKRSLTQRNNDSDSKIKLITRPSNAKDFDPPGYGLYSYLLFGSNSEASRKQRLAASRAYCRNFERISTELLSRVSINNLNIFQVLVKNAVPGEKYCENPDVLTDDYYDYTRAEELLQYIGIEGDGIYLVACDKPILTYGCVRSRMLVMDLSTVQERLIELSVLEFRRQTRKKEYLNDRTISNLMFALRKALPKVAEFISIATAAAKER
jgi:hypothetical protein